LAGSLGCGRFVKFSNLAHVFDSLPSGK
jgi:hypothetical protein